MQLQWFDYVFTFHEMKIIEDRKLTYSRTFDRVLKKKKKKKNSETLHYLCHFMLFQAGNEVKYLTVTDVFIRLDANVGHMFMRWSDTVFIPN